MAHLQPAIIIASIQSFYSDQSDFHQVPLGLVHFSVSWVTLAGVRSRLSKKNVGRCPGPSMMREVKNSSDFNYHL